MKTILCISFVLVLLFLFVMPVLAQDNESTIHYEIVQYHVDRAKIDSLKVLENQYYTKIIEKQKGQD